MVEIASQILICMLIATFIGFIMGYIIGKSQIPTAEQSIKEDTKLPPQTNDVEIKEAIVEEQKPTSNPEKKEAIVDEPTVVEPELLSNPRDGKKDDLTKIKGIGVKLETKLNDAGIYHFDQIANWTEENIKWIEKHTPLNNRIKKEPWVGQAKKYL